MRGYMCHKCYNLIIWCGQIGISIDILYGIGTTIITILILSEELKSIQYLFYVFDKSYILLNIRFTIVGPSRKTGSTLYFNLLK